MKSFPKTRQFWTLSLLCLGSAALSPAQSETEEARTNSECAGASRVVQTIRINNGVRTERATASAPAAVISIPITHHPDHYIRCLEMEGRNPPVAKMIYFHDFDRCKREASSKPRVSISAKTGPILESSFDAAEFEQCMQPEGRKLEVELIRENAE